MIINFWKMQFRIKKIRRLKNWQKMMVHFHHFKVNFFCKVHVILDLSTYFLIKWNNDEKHQYFCKVHDIKKNSWIHEKKNKWKDKIKNILPWKNFHKEFWWEKLIKYGDCPCINEREISWLVRALYISISKTWLKWKWKIFSMVNGYHDRSAFNKNIIL